MARKKGRKVWIDWSSAVKPTIILASSPLCFEITVIRNNREQTVEFSGTRIELSPDNLGENTFIDAQIALANSLTPQDKVFLEMGAGADDFCTRLAYRSVPVFRIPPKRLKNIAEERGIEQTVDALKWVSENNIFLYYLFDAKSQEIADLSAKLRAFYRAQKRIRIPNQQRHISLRRSAYFLLPDNSDLRVREEELRRGSLEANIAEEEFWYDLLEERVEASEFARVYLSPIYGVGPRIVGRIVATISDIRRFKTVDDLVSYLGYDVHFVKVGDEVHGEAPIMRRGEELGYHPFGQQGVWNFTQYLVKSPRSPLRYCYLHRRKVYAKNYKRRNHTDPPDWKVHKAAMRYIGQAFINYIYFAWKHYLDESPDKVNWRGWDLYNTWESKMPKKAKKPAAKRAKAASAPKRKKAAV